MAQSRATSVSEYLASLPADRRAAVEAARAVFRAHLDPDLEEGMQYGMIGYYIPHRVYPAGYHCDPRQPLPYAGIASQKNHLSLYLTCLYASPQLDAWFRSAWEATGRKLDKGKACIRFRGADDLAVDVLAEALRRVPARAYIAMYEANLKPAGRAAAKKVPAKKAAAKKVPAKKATAAKAAAKKSPTRGATRGR